MNEELQIERPREIKANDTYYILKRSEAPTVIVECGFLSNEKEAATFSYRCLSAEGSRINLSWYSEIFCSKNVNGVLGCR